MPPTQNLPALSIAPRFISVGSIGHDLPPKAMEIRTFVLQAVRSIQKKNPSPKTIVTDGMTRILASPNQVLVHRVQHSKWPVLEQKDLQ